MSNLKLKGKTQEMYKLLVELYEDAFLKIDNEDIIYEVSNEVWQKLEDMLNSIEL